MLNASPSGFCVEKPQPNFKRDGIFIVSLILIVLVLELASGTDNTVTMQTIPKEKSQPATAALAPAPPAPVAPVAPGELIQFDTPTGWAKSANASPMTTFALDLPGGATVSASDTESSENWRMSENILRLNQTLLFRKYTLCLPPEAKKRKLCRNTFGLIPSFL